MRDLGWHEGFLSFTGRVIFPTATFTALTHRASCLLCLHPAPWPQPPRPDRTAVVTILGVTDPAPYPPGRQAQVDLHLLLILYSQPALGTLPSSRTRSTGPRPGATAAAVQTRGPPPRTHSPAVQTWGPLSLGHGPAGQAQEQGNRTREPEQAQAQAQGSGVGAAGPEHGAGHGPRSASRPPMPMGARTLLPLLPCSPCALPLLPLCPVAWQGTPCPRLPCCQCHALWIG